MTDEQRYEFYIAGVQHHEAHKVLKELEEGMYLNLNSEPTNKYDPSAVKIEFYDDAEATMLGYVPGKISSRVTAFLFTGDNPICRITELDKEAKPWKQIKVVIEESGPDLGKEGF